MGQLTEVLYEMARRTNEFVCLFRGRADRKRFEPFLGSKLEYRSLLFGLSAWVGDELLKICLRGFNHGIVIVIIVIIDHSHYFHPFVIWGQDPQIENRIMRYYGETASTCPTWGYLSISAFDASLAREYIERMLKSSGGRPPIGGGPASTKQRIIQAAFDTLSKDGFAAATARAIARRGGFNQALIFYHFGTLNDLLLAALEVSGKARLDRYREAMSVANTFDERIQTATNLYREDLDSGHITVLAEIIAGSLSEPRLGPKVIDLMKPWIEFAAGVIKESISGTAFEALIDPQTAAFAVVAMYLGVDLLTLLDKDDSRADALFQSAGGLAKLLTAG